ncbi:MAG: hypothetical protein ACKOLA_03060 [Spartobacteria bacterium]
MHWERKQVLPLRRMPITAIALPGTAGKRISRRVSSGTSETKASFNF